MANDNKPTIGSYRYRCRSTGASSSKYGACEVCKQHASEVFIQAEAVWHPADELDDSHAREAGGFWTSDGCTTLFGHETCLVGVRRAPVFEVIQPRSKKAPL